MQSNPYKPSKYENPHPERAFSAMETNLNSRGSIIETHKYSIRQYRQSQYEKLPQNFNIDSKVPQPINLMPTECIRCMNCGQMVLCSQLQAHIVSKHVKSEQQDIEPVDNDAIRIPCCQLDCLSSKTINNRQDQAINAYALGHNRYEQVVIRQLDEEFAPRIKTVPKKPDHFKIQSASTVFKSEQPEQHIPILEQNKLGAQTYKPSLKPIKYERGVQLEFDQPVSKSHQVGKTVLESRSPNYQIFTSNQRTPVMARRKAAQHVEATPPSFQETLLQFQEQNKISYAQREQLQIIVNHKLNPGRRQEITHNFHQLSKKQVGQLLLRLREETRVSRQDLVQSKFVRPVQNDQRSSAVPNFRTRIPIVPEAEQSMNRVGCHMSAACCTNQGCCQCQVVCCGYTNAQAAHYTNLQAQAIQGSRVRYQTSVSYVPETITVMRPVYTYKPIVQNVQYLNEEEMKASKGLSQTGIKWTINQQAGIYGNRGSQWRPIKAHQMQHWRQIFNSEYKVEKPEVFDRWVTEAIISGCRTKEQFADYIKAQIK